MAQLILSGFTVESFEEQLRSIIKTELEAHNKPQDQEQFISRKEVCKMFTPNISLPTVYKWTEQGRLIAYRIKGRVYYKRTEVLQALQSEKKYSRG